MPLIGKTNMYSNWNHLHDPAQGLNLQPNSNLESGVERLGQSTKKPRLSVNWLWGSWDVVREVYKCSTSTARLTSCIHYTWECSTNVSTGILLRHCSCVIHNTFASLQFEQATSLMDTNITWMPCLKKYRNAIRECMMHPKPPNHPKTFFLTLRWSYWHCNSIWANYFQV